LQCRDNSSDQKANYANRAYRAVLSYLHCELQTELNMAIKSRIDIAIEKEELGQGTWKLGVCKV